MRMIEMAQARGHIHSSGSQAGGSVAYENTRGLTGRRISVAATALMFSLWMPLGCHPTPQVVVTHTPVDSAFSGVPVP